MPKPPQNKTTFITFLSLFNSQFTGSVSAEPSKDLDVRYWNYAFAIPIPNVGKLGNNLLLQIPRQNKNIVWFSFLNLLGREDGNMRSCGVFPVLVRVPVYRVVEEIRPDTTVIQESITFPRGAVADNLFPLPLGLQQEF